MRISNHLHLLVVMRSSVQGMEEPWRWVRKNCGVPEETLAPRARGTDRNGLYAVPEEESSMTHPMGEMVLLCLEWGD